MAWKCEGQYQWEIRSKVHKKRHPKWFMDTGRPTNRPLSRRSTRICRNRAWLGLNTISPAISIWLSFVNFLCESALDKSFRSLILDIFSFLQKVYYRKSRKMIKKDNLKKGLHKTKKKYYAHQCHSDRGKSLNNDCANSKGWKVSSFSNNSTYPFWVRPPGP